MKTSKPNIILIITDQQRFDTINALGFPYMDTPNLDYLVENGVAFTNAFITAPSCAPSRASLFTGKYPHSTGTYKNDDSWGRTWVSDLSESGYHCVNIGKMHTSPYDAPMGFAERYVVENKDRQNPKLPFFIDEWDKALRVRGLEKPGRLTYCKREDFRERLGAFEWELPEEMHPDMFVGELAEWWLENRPKIDKPFFLEIGFPGPHPPYDPISRYLDGYRDKELPLPKVTEEEILAQPRAFQELRQQHLRLHHDSIVHLENASEDQLHRQRASYFANVSMIDDMIGRIFNALESQGYLDNSIIIFASDHGDCLGDHGHSQKWTMYDSVVHVPMILWAPSLVQQGKRVDKLCQLMDLGPTILELAGVQVPGSMDARSLLPLIMESNAKGRDYVFAEHARDPILEGTEFMTMIRDGNWKLVHFVDDTYGQLFDLTNDPEERINLWEEPRHEHKRMELLHEILKWRIQTGLSV